MWILKIQNKNSFKFYVAPYEIILKYIKENFININKIDDYNFVCCDKEKNENIIITINLGEKLYVKQKDNSLHNRQHR